jgi:hypothetical protein
VRQQLTVLGGVCPSVLSGYGQSRSKYDLALADFNNELDLTVKVQCTSGFRRHGQSAGRIHDHWFAERPHLTNPSTFGNLAIRSIGWTQALTAIVYCLVVEHPDIVGARDRAQHNPTFMSPACSWEAAKTSTLIATR